MECVDDVLSFLWHALPGVGRAALVPAAAEDGAAASSIRS